MPVRKECTLALIGDSGMLARKVREEAPKGWRVEGFDLPEFDLTDVVPARRALAKTAPDVIVNCAAYTDVDGCETNRELALRVNGEGPGLLAAAALELGATLVQISTDYVFSGEGECPYREPDPTGPRSVYGRSKLAGEKAVEGSGLDRFFIVRTSWLYGPGGRNFVETMVRLGREREELRVVDDQVGSPTYTGDLARGIFQLLAREGEASAPYGTYHFADRGSCSWFRFAEAIHEEARTAGEPIVTRRLLPIRTEEYPLPAPRPACSILATEKFRSATGAEIPPWRESLRRYFRNDRS